MSTPEVLSSREKRDQKNRERVYLALPHLEKLVELWADHLEFWDRSGGLDNATQEELDQARDSIKAKAEKILEEHYPGDISIVEAHVNLALHTAIGMRKEAALVSLGDFDGQKADS